MHQIFTLDVAKSGQLNIGTLFNVSNEGASIYVHQIISPFLLVSTENLMKYCFFPIGFWHRSLGSASRNLLPHSYLSCSVVQQPHGQNLQRLDERVFLRSEWSGFGNLSLDMWDFRRGLQTSTQLFSAIFWDDLNDETPHVSHAFSPTGQFWLLKFELTNWPWH